MIVYQELTVGEGVFNFIIVVKQSQPPCAVDSWSLGFYLHLAFSEQKSGLLVRLVIASPPGYIIII